MPITRKDEDGTHKAIQSPQLVRGAVGNFATDLNRLERETKASLDKIRILRDSSGLSSNARTMIGEWESTLSDVHEKLSSLHKETLNAWRGSDALKV